jgi:hypothetical protein
MARDGSGGHSLPNGTYTPNTLADADKVTADFQDLSSGIAQSISKDGQTTPTANLQMGGFKLTGMGAGSAAEDSVNLGQAQAQAFLWAGTTGGTADALTLSPSPAITAYAAGQHFRFIAASNNTGAATAAVSGLTAKAIQNGGDALVADDIEAGALYEMVYDGAAFQISRLRLNTPATISAQPLDSDLTTIAALSPSEGQVLTFSSSAWTAATPTNAAETDMRLAFLLLAELSGDRLNMTDGIADAYEDESDVDTGSSSNQNYDGTNDYYHNVTGGGTSDGGHTTPGVSGAGNTTVFDRTFSLTNGKTVSQVSIYSASAVTVKAKIGLENSSTDIDVVYDESFSHTGSGWETFNLTTPHAIPGSGTYRLGSFSASNMNRVNSTHDVAYYSGDATGSGETYTAASNYSRFCQAIYAEVVSNMTIVSEAFTADSEPDTARIHVQAAPQEAITVNTDLLADVSRDDGSTWTTATLVAVQTLADGTIAYEDNEIDISAQPSGTDMRYRIRTANTKSIQIHGTVEQWA